MRKVLFTLACCIGALLPHNTAHAGETVCQQDGLAQLCGSATTAQDVVRINYEITQLDGPGRYRIFYLDLDSSTSTPPQEVPALRHNETVSGALFGRLNHCFQLVLTSQYNSILRVGPICE
ncbi:MAG: hypothetical protein HOQ05_08125 [Corynebacteriales bacterium]|nr:hypothetical protein [Mycobacteriales bacterium]